MYAHKEAWGYSLWVRGIQIGAGVGLDFQAFRLGRAMSKVESRIWNRRGIFKIA